MRSSQLKSDVSGRSSLMVARRWILAAAAFVGAIFGAAAPASAQPFNVRAWYAEGQVFVLWQFVAPPPVPTDTVEIFASAAAQATTANMTRIGRMFFPEYTGSRLTALAAGSRLLVPTPGGGTYRLAADEGVFVYTPRAAGNLFFAVVDTGAAAVNAGNSDATAFAYDPVNDPAAPHPQFNGLTPGGFPYTAYVVWADGRDDYDNARPDVPVLADADKNGVPSVFVVTRPLNALPAGPVSCVFAHHGGGGEYELFLPGVPARANVSLPLTDGIVVTPDDSIYANVNGTLNRTNTSWFGYAPEFDPFIGGARPSLPSEAVVVNFTQRRVHWILDWLLSGRAPVTVDPRRIAAIGHSGGGRGVSHLTRLRPERFASVVVYTPASDLSIDAGTRENYLRGDWDANLATNILDASGAPIGVTDVFTMNTRLSPQRDFALTRIFYGKRDQDDSASWSPAQRAVFDSLNDAQVGYMLFWDEREHGVEKWQAETPDGADGNPDPWPDVAQWIAPIRTRRASGQYLVDQYRADQSYPGFFNADQAPDVTGVQPDPGPGDPSVGDPWGTWGGYFDWDTATIVDLPNRWECTVFAAAAQPASIDDAPAIEFMTDVAPRKVNQFNPSPGARVYWYALRSTTQTVQQQGEILADAEGVCKIAGVRIPRSDVDQVRIYLSLNPLCLGTTQISGPADVTGCPDVASTFSVAALGSGPFLYQWQWTHPVSQPAWTDVALGANLTAAGLPAFFAAAPTTGSVTVSSFARGLAGVRFRCQVTSPCGSGPTSEARLVFCPADVDDGSALGTCDGGVGIEDLLYYLSIYDAGIVEADVDDGSGSGTPDGGMGIEDLLYFLFRYDGGC